MEVPIGDRHKWLPLAVAAIFFATTVPVELRLAAAPAWRPEAGDVLINLLLYAPLGWALRQRGWAAIGGGALLSAGIEILQIWFIGRQPSVYDTLANAAGTALGVVLGRRLSGRVTPESLVPPRRLLGVAAAVAAVLIAVLIARGGDRQNLATWDRSYQPLLGNEHTGDRPWSGTISALAIVPRAISERDIRRVSGGDRTAISRDGSWTVDHPVTLDGTGRAVSGARTPALFDSIVASGAFTVVVRASTADVTQEGPARLVTLSRDQFHRNFDVGQQGQRIRFRVRTPAAGPNGNDVYAETDAILEAGRPVTVIGVYDGLTSKIYVDGKLEARTNLAAAGCRVRSVCDTDLPLATGVFGALTAFAVLALPQSRRRRLPLIVVTAGVAATLLAVAGAGAAVPRFRPWLPLSAVTAAAVVALSARDAGRAARP